MVAVPTEAEPAPTNSPDPLVTGATGATGTPRAFLIRAGQNVDTIFSHAPQFLLIRCV